MLSLQSKTSTLSYDGKAKAQEGLESPSPLSTLMVVLMFSEPLDVRSALHVLSFIVSLIHGGKKISAVFCPDSSPAGTLTAGDM